MEGESSAREEGETRVEPDEEVEGQAVSGGDVTEEAGDKAGTDATERQCSEEYSPPDRQEGNEEDMGGKREGVGEDGQRSDQSSVDSEEERVTEKEHQREDREVVAGGSESESSSEDEAGEEDSAGAGSSRWSSREETMRRLRELHRRRLEARQLNHREVVEEDRRNKLPANWGARQRKMEWEEDDEKARKEAEDAGEDYERQKMLQTSASDLERLQRKRKKKNPDTGFADYAQAQFRQYDRLTKQLKPDMEIYEKQKMEMGADFYPGVNSLVHGGSGKVSKAGIEHMTEDLEKQIEKRAKYSRRRPFDESKDVDYINERNMKFNKKAARFYDKYTAELKQNLERGTAV